MSTRERLNLPVPKCPGLAGCLGGNEGWPSFFGLARKMVAGPLGECSVTDGVRSLSQPFDITLIFVTHYCMRG